MNLELTEKEMYILGVLVNRAKEQYPDNWVLKELWSKIQLENLGKYGKEVKYGRRKDDIMHSDAWKE